MTADIEVTEGQATAAAQVIVTQPRPTGWMAFYRYDKTNYFSHASDPNLGTARNYFRCPYPLFETKDAAIEAAKYWLRDQGGEVRLVEVRL